MTERPMTEKERVIELLAQTLAPRLYKLFGVKPEEMGFPFGDTPEDVDAHIERMFDPVGHWTDQARGIAVSVVNILEAGGLTVDIAVTDAMLKAALRERPDVDDRRDRKQESDKQL